MDGFPCTAFFIKTNEIGTSLKSNLTHSGSPLCEEQWLNVRFNVPHCGI